MFSNWPSGLSKWLMSVVLLCGISALTYAATPAGTVINNQASAIYRDSTGQWQSVTSNLVQTTVQQVAALTLQNNQQLRAEAESTVSVVHQVSNTGNGDDRIALSVVNLLGDDFDLSALTLYADRDENGLADNDIAISNTDWLAPGESFSFVVQGQLPAGPSANQSAAIRIQASSEFDGAVNAINTDTILVTEGAVLRSSKRFERTRGPLSGTAFDTVITLTNVGSSDALEVVLLDALPIGMSYVASSATVNASAVILSDNDPTDVQNVGSLALRYCAYQADCAGLPESQRDADSTSANQITLFINKLAVGESASLRFSVKVENDTGVNVLANQAEIQYQSDVGGATLETASNVAIYRILPSVGVVANGSTQNSINGSDEPLNISTAAQGTRILFNNRIWNTGSRTDTFNMQVDALSSSFPAGSVFSLLSADGQTPLLDSNQDGIADTGPLQAGSFATVVLAVLLPPDAQGNNGLQGYAITKTARSINDPRVFDSVTDTLDSIEPATVDLTNQAPAGNAQATGVGAGPESSPVSTEMLVVEAGANGHSTYGSAVFDLYVRHSGAKPDQYQMKAMATPGGEPLPASITVSFIDPASGLPLISTGPLADGDSRHVKAVVHVTGELNASVISLYFTATSPTTGVSDSKHDAIQIASTAKLELSPDLSAYASPGEFVVYKHRLENTGNSAINDITLNSVHDNSDWPRTLYADTDGNGRLSSGDAQIDSTLSLQPGESTLLFLKIFIPSNAAISKRVVTRLTASWNAGSNSTSVVDVSTVSEVTVMIFKEQALDNGCDGTPDLADGFVTEPLAVAPGDNCVIYRLTATNQGLAPSFNVAILDSTPPYTLYHPSASCSRAACQLSEPLADERGEVKALVNQLSPGDSFNLQFSVKIE